MAVNEYPVLLTAKDAEGNTRLLYPITRVDCVDGVEELIDEKVTEAVQAIETPEAEQVQGNWEQTDATAKDYIQNKPFGLAPTILPNRTMQFEAMQESDSLFKMTPVKTVKLVEGETYIVTWAGTQQEVVAKLSPYSSEDTVILGNSSLFDGLFNSVLGEDTGEPFVFYNGSTQEDGVIFDSLCCLTNDTSTSTRGVEIQPANKEKKLSFEWLPDGIASEDFVREQIAAIESSSYTETDIYPEQTWITGYLTDFGANGYEYPFDEDHPMFPLVLGDECIVVWDGVEYEVTVGDSSSILPGSLFVGNGSAFGLAGNNEPFGIAWTIYGATFVAFADSEPTEHTVRVYTKTALDSISWKDVTDKPFGEMLTTIFEGTFQDTLVDNDGDGVNDSWSNTLVIEDTSDAKLEDGKTYIVTWDGVEYSCEASKYGGYLSIGNAAIYIQTANDTGEPFFILRDDDGSGFGRACWVAMSANPPADLTVSVIYTCKIEGENTKKIADKYQHQADFNETDVTSAAHILNRPFGPILAEGAVVFDRTATYDENDFGLILYGAAAKNIVVGAEYAAICGDLELTGKGISAAEVVYLMDGLTPNPGIKLYDSDNTHVGTLYNCINGIAMVGIWFAEAYKAYFVNGQSYTVKIVAAKEAIKKLEEKYIPDSVKLPAATDEDNNKFLRLVDGVPAWVSLTDVSQEGA